MGQTSILQQETGIRYTMVCHCQQITETIGTEQNIVAFVARTLSQAGKSNNEHASVDGQLELTYNERCMCH